MKILDLHTHLPAPRPESIISCSPDELPGPEEFPGQSYSCGFHPWKLDSLRGPEAEKEWERLEKALGREDVVAVGECGIDIPKGGPLFFQRKVFRRQAELAAKVGKPLIIHCVKAHDHIIAYLKELQPQVNWGIHGFRGKPAIAEMFLKAGIWLIYGERFNPESLAITPRNQILAETDESSRSISEIILALGLTAEEAAENASRFLDTPRV